MSALGTSAMVLLVAGAAQATSLPSDIRVGTQQGEVVGVRQDRLAVFKGIPFAAPPVGDLRFRAPQPHAAWTTPLRATAYGVACPQTPTTVGNYSTIPQGEDCLTLNVWAPVSRGPRLPVLVFLHGGGFKLDAPSQPTYDGATIAGNGGVVVVTLNYRLGMLGFLAAPALDAENDAHVSGNYGIQDQTRALQWVHDNIAAFGGDPSNVTLSGESAGAISTAFHLISPADTGLFSKALMESPVIAASESTLAAYESGSAATFIASTGCNTASDVAACLRALPASAFTTTVGSATPVIDGTVIREQPQTAIAAGRFHHVPVLIGSNLNEWTPYVAALVTSYGHPMSEADYQAQLTTSFGSLASDVAAEYPSSDYQSQIQAYSAVEGDYLVACPTHRTLLALGRQVPSFAYEFSELDPAHGVLYRAPMAGLDYGDYHSAEVSYVFGQDENGVALAGKDKVLSDRMIRNWTNFTKSGNPNIPLSAYSFDGIWPAFAYNEAVFTFKDSVSTEYDFAKIHHCDFWATRSSF